MAEPPQNRPLTQLGPGDGVTIQVVGQPDMTVTVTVSDDASVNVPFVGNVPVGGLSPSEAASRIEKALVDAKILVHPQVNVTVTSARSQRVSVLGEVSSPGRYPIESNTTIFDLLAIAGGAKETGGSTIFVLRRESDGRVIRFPINLNKLSDPTDDQVPFELHGGDTIIVPKAPQVYVFGEVTAPSVYKIEPGMTVLQAIARAGGVTPRGSINRFEVKRKDGNGEEHIVKLKLTDPVQAEDVIRVKESIF